METLTSKDIGIPFIISLIVNIVSGYLFSLELINFITFILIVIGSLIVIIIIGLQLKTNEIKENLRELKNNFKELKEKVRLNQENLEERFKIYERLIILEEKINNVRKRGK